MKKYFSSYLKEKETNIFFTKIRYSKNTLRLKASKSHHIFFPAIQKNGVKKQKIPEKKSPSHYVKTKHYKVPLKTP